MIVKCDQCQTRFKIPDEKVTEKGVKVRCTRCQHTFRVSRAPAGGVPAIPPAEPPPPAVKPDPFASFGIGMPSPPDQATRPGFFPEGIAASKETSSPGMSAVLGQHGNLPPEVFDSPTRIAPVPAGLRDPLPPPVAAPSGFDPSDPFAGIDTRPPSDFAPTSPSVATVPPPEAFPAPPPPPPTSFESGAATGFDRSAFLSDLPAPTEQMVASSSAESAAAAVATSADLLGALPPPPGDDPFSSVDLHGGSAGFGEGEHAGFSAEPDRGLFDMPAPSAAEDNEPTVPTSSGGGVALGRMTPAPAAASESAQKPHGRPDDVGMGEVTRPGTARRAVGLVVNLAVASALLVALVSVGTIFLNEGRVDPSSLSLDPLKALFRAPAELRAVDVSNGLYDTRSGRQLFYVRGEVENRGKTPAHVVVRVSIVDGALTVGTAEAPLGFSPSPEDLYALSSPRDLAALQAKAHPAAEPLAPGAKQPFLLAFYDYPPDLSEYQLKVTVERTAEDGAAAQKTAER